MTSAEEYATLARTHLSATLADRWISLLRPAVEFPYPTEPVDPEHVALSTGGDPLLPDDVAWPEVDGYGPLMFVSDMDCAAVAAAGGVEPLPTEGNLLFFFAGHPDRFPERWMGPDSGRWTAWEQGRVIYLPPGTERKPRQAPAENDADDDWLDPIEPRSYRAQLISTPPSTTSEMIEHNFGTDIKAQSDAYWEAMFKAGMPRTPPAGIAFELDNAFDSAVRENWGYCYTGGYPHPCQHRPLELEAAVAALGDGTKMSDARAIEEAGHWRLLYQDGWEAGDLILYWMIRDDDLAARRFDRIWFGQQR